MMVNVSYDSDSNSDDELVYTTESSSDSSESYDNPNYKSRKPDSLLNQRGNKAKKPIAAEAASSGSGELIPKKKPEVDFLFDGTKYLCKVCDYWSKRGACIRFHLLKNHQIKVKRFSCSYYSKTFYNLQWFFKHKQVCAASSQLTHFYNVVEGWYLCTSCPFKSHKTNTINHIKAVHLKAEEFECPNYLRKLSWARNLSRYTKRFINE